MFDGGEIRGSMVPSQEKMSLDVTPTMTERLKRERANLASRLAEVDAALAVVESNPQVQQVIDALTKLHWLR
mgnify:CR=1 FL=1